MNIDQIVAEYARTGYIKATAQSAGMSPSKCRRILINQGAYHSETSDTIRAMVQKRMTAPQIAAHLNISTKAVMSYLPYSRGLYFGEDPTPNAVKIRRWREKKAQNIEAAKAARDEAQALLIQKHGNSAMTPKSKNTQTPKNR